MMDFFMSVLVFVVATSSIALLALLILWPFYAFYKAASVADPIFPKQNGSDADSPNEIGLQDWEGGEEFKPKQKQTSEEAKLMLFEWERYKRGDFVFDTDDYPLRRKPKV